MKKRVDALDVILERFKRHKVELNIKTLKHNPVVEIHDKDMPALIVLSGEDTIIKESVRNERGVPKIRAFNFTVEMIVNRLTDKRNLVESLCQVRDILLDNPYPIVLADGSLDKTTFIFEVGTDGPYPYRVANIEGIQLLACLRYEDTGTYSN